jgi:dihydrofolate reductase
MVVSRNAGFAGAGIVVGADLDVALAVARGDALRRGVDEIAVIGGADIFARLMPLADRLEITHVHARPDGDTHFPPIDASQWRAIEQSELPAGPRDDAPVTYVTYARA